MTDSSNILVRRAGDEDWTAPESSRYDREDHLQQVVAASPHWVPGVPEGALSIREFTTSAGPVDVMIVAPDGALTAVECKLESNPEKRRTVIGQLIDYTSAVWRAGPDRFIDQWKFRADTSLESALAPEALGELRSRIATGTIALCWVVDRIDDDLRRLIEYLNELTRDQVAVTALQLAYARHGELEILIPSTYGGEIAAAKATHSGRRSENWSRESFAEAVEDPGDRALLARLFELADRNAQATGLGEKRRLTFGSRPGGAIFFYPYGLWNATFKLAIRDGRLTIAGCWQRFPQVAQHPGFAELAALLGQKESGPTKFVPIAGYDPDALWKLAERTALQIHADTTISEESL
jgi:hypothetical protein